MTNSAFHVAMREAEQRDAGLVHAVLGRKPRARHPKQRHAFMGLLTCARCGCSMTAEKKKGKYIYYRCTGYHGACGNTYIREEQLAGLLGTVIAPIQISPEIAEDTATALNRRRPRANGIVRTHSDSSTNVG